MKTTKIIKTSALLLGVVAMLLASSARATLSWTPPLTLNSPNVVGTVNGLAGDNPGPDEPYFAQELLDLPANTVNFPYTDSSSGVEHIYNTSPTEYSGTIISSTLSHVDGGITAVPAGFEYVIAKYGGGDNGGYVLFYLGGEDANLPLNGWSLFWNGKSPDSYGISDYTAFSTVPEASTVIAGLLLLLPLGASAIRILRRKQTA